MKSIYLLYFLPEKQNKTKGKKTHLFLIPIHPQILVNNIFYLIILWRWFQGGEDSLKKWGVNTIWQRFEIGVASRKKFWLKKSIFFKSMCIRILQRNNLYTYRKRERDLHELAHMIAGAGKSEIHRPGPQAANPGRSLLWSWILRKLWGRFPSFPKDFSLLKLSIDWINPQTYYEK